MIKKLNSTLKKVNHAIGIDIEIPKPTKSALKLSRGFCSVLGASCIPVGIIISSKALLVLGTLGTISAIATTHEIKNNFNKSWKPML